MKPAIVVVAYNRPKSLKRILTSINEANYHNYQDIHLIISIDRGDNEEVVNIAEDFLWRYGSKKVIYQDKNLGLRNHILKCGSLTEKYKSIILLEDDLYVAPNFYQYAREALEFSHNKDYIGGISLYNHKLNVLVNEPFSSINDGYDNWYFQFASSWGQAWTYEQWHDFITWYYKNKDKSLVSENFPKYIANWPKTSWLKYYIKYLVETDKYFLYPQISHTTNFSDKGTHVGTDNTDFQVPLQLNKCKSYYFSEITETNAIYDVFFENKNLYKILNIDQKDLCVNLYGNKISNQRYHLTRNILDYGILKSFGCCLRPHDVNIIYSIDGNDFYLYDTSIENKNNINKREQQYRKLRYIIKAKTNTQYLLLLKMLLEKLLRRTFKK